MRILCLIALAMPAIASAQPVRSVEAVTESGATVVLFEDGTWAPSDIRSDAPPETIAPVREGERVESTQYRYAVWVPEGWGPAIDRLTSGELEFAEHGDDEGGVRVSLEVLPHASMAEWGHPGPARLQAVQRLLSLFAGWVEVDGVTADELVVEGQRASRVRLQAPGMDLWVAAVEVPAGVLLLQATLEVGEGDVAAVGQRFLQGLEIDESFTRDPCEVYPPLRRGFALEVPTGWAVARQLEASGSLGVDLELVEAEPLRGRAPARALVVTAPDDDAEALEDVAEALLADVLEVGAPKAPWNVYPFGSGPVGTPDEIALRTFAAADVAERVVDVAAFRGGGHVALAVVAAPEASSMRYAVSTFAEGLRVCR